MPYIGQGLQQGRRQRSTFTATASQTTFAHSYAVGYVDVYQNGILLAPSDYTATNGTQIILAVGAALNDEITIISQHLFSVADVVSATGGTFSGNVTVTGNLTVQGSTIAVDTATAQTVDLGDSDKVRLGDGNDLQMYHDGSNSYIDHIGPDEQTLYIRNTTSTTNTTDGIVLESNNHYVHITNNAAVRFGVNGSDMVSVIGSGTYFNHDVILNGIGKEIKYRNGSYYVTLDAVNATTDTTAIVPNFDGTIPVFTTAPTSAIADGTAGQVLTTDGAGALSFTTVANSSFTTDVTVTSSGISGSANLMLNNTETTNNFGKAIEAFRSGITTGKRHQILLGKDSSNNDTSTISYYYAGNASSNNRLEFGFWGADALLNVRADGNIGIGTDSPSQKLHISSADHTRVLITGGTDKYAELQFENDAQKFAMGIQDDDKFFLYNSTGTSQVLTIDTSNNVGIGTQSPDGKLNVVSTAHNNGAIFDSTGTTQAWFRDTDATSNQRNWGIQVSGGDFNILRANDDRASGFITPIHIQQAPTNSLVINSSGYVGIGTISPDTLLNLQKTRAGSISAGSSDTGAVIKLHTEAQWESGYGNDTDSPNNDYLGGIEFSSGDGSTGEGVRAAIRGTVDTYYNTNSIVFETANSATAETPIERMRIQYDGKVGIGTGVPSVGLEVSGDTPNDEISIKYSGTAGGHNSKYLFKDKRGQTNAGIYNNLQDDGVGSAAAHMQFYTSTGGTLSTQMAISRYGYVTTPNQPSCSVYNMGFSGSSSNWSSAGSGSVNGAIWTTNVHHNNGNHYNTSNGYFTAPTDGYFLCNLNVYGKKNTNHGDTTGYWWGYFQKNGGYYAGNYIMEAYYNSGDYDQGASISAVIKLALNDTVRPYMGAYSDGISVYGPNTSFSVHMIG